MVNIIELIKENQKTPVDTGYILGYIHGQEKAGIDMTDIRKEAAKIKGMEHLDWS